MGVEVSKCIDQSPEAEANRVATNVLQESARKENQIIKMLLLGAGGCGKTTLFKQMKIIYAANGFPAAELERQKDIVRKNVLDIFQMLLHYIETHEIPMKQTDFIVDLKNQTYHTFQLLPELVQPLQELWQHPALRKAFSKRAQMDYNDNAEYFVKELNRLSSPDYTPTMDDVLRTRQRTLGITENTFDIDKAKFKMVDVGGQRNERRKWIHAFDSVTCVIFVVALSEYDQILAEMDDQNRMEESFKLFDDICNQRFFRDKPVMIFFNKSDIFARKINEEKININVCKLFADYPGGLNVEVAQDFIIAKFKQLGEQGAVKKEGAQSSGLKKRQIYTYVTNATDTGAMRKLFDTVRGIILKSLLGEFRME